MEASLLILSSTYVLRSSNHAPATPLTSSRDRSLGAARITWAKLGREAPRNPQAVDGIRHDHGVGAGLEPHPRPLEMVGDLVEVPNLPRQRAVCVQGSASRPLLHG